MKAKIFKGLIVVLTVMLVSTAFIGCKPLSEAEKTLVGKYFLVSISGRKPNAQPDEDGNIENPYEYINADFYEHYTLEFKDNRDCFISYKIPNSTYNEKGTWQMSDDGHIEIVIKIKRTKMTEKYKFDGTYISGKNKFATNSGTVELTASFIKMQ